MIHIFHARCLEAFISLSLFFDIFDFIYAFKRLRAADHDTPIHIAQVLGRASSLAALRTRPISARLAAAHEPIYITGFSACFGLASYTLPAYLFVCFSISSPPISYDNDGDGAVTLMLR